MGEAQGTDRPDLLSVLREAEQRLELDKRRGGEGEGQRTKPSTDGNGRQLNRELKWRTGTDRF